MGRTASALERPFFSEASEGVDVPWITHDLKPKASLGGAFDEVASLSPVEGGVEFADDAEDRFAYAEHGFQNTGRGGGLLHLEVDVDDGGDRLVFSVGGIGLNPGRQDIRGMGLDSVSDPLEEVGRDAVVGIHEHEPVRVGSASAEVALVADIAGFGPQDVEAPEGVSELSGFLDCLVFRVAVDQGDLEVFEGLVLQVSQEFGETALFIERWDDDREGRFVTSAIHKSW